LLPGSNLVAAAVHEARGDRSEAERALNLLKNWRQLGSADGPLSRIAELLPGVDIVAFGLHINGGHYAQALRSIAKTRWVDITATSVTARATVESVQELGLVDLDTHEFALHPMAFLTCSQTFWR